MKDQRTKELDQLSELLQRRPLTAKEIALELGCCIPTAYQRVLGLMKRGEAVYEVKSKKGTSPGPRATRFGVNDG